jgi:hypothetical protein
MSTESPRRDSRHSRGAIHGELAVIERHIAVSRGFFLLLNRGVAKQERPEGIYHPKEGMYE